MIGEIPDKIMPVIVPGRETNPTAKREFVIGINEALNASFLWFLKEEPCSYSFSKRSAARLTEFIQLAKIIPPKGIKKCGLYHGVVRITTCVTINTVSVPAKKIDIMEYL